MKKFYDIEIDSQVELENGKTLGKLEESKISVNDGNCGSGGGVQTIYANNRYFVFDENDVDIDFNSEDERFVSYAEILRMFNNGVVRANMQNGDISTITRVITSSSISGCAIYVAGDDNAFFSRDYVTRER